MINGTEKLYGPGNIQEEADSHNDVDHEDFDDADDIDDDEDDDDY